MELADVEAAVVDRVAEEVLDTAVVEGLAEAVEAGLLRADTAAVTVAGVVLAMRRTEEGERQKPDGRLTMFTTRKRPGSLERS